MFEPRGERIIDEHFAVTWNEYRGLVFRDLRQQPIAVGSSIFHEQLERRADGEVRSHAQEL